MGCPQQPAADFAPLGRKALVVSHWPVHSESFDHDLTQKILINI
jgi:hypothetical protein